MPVGLLLNKDNQFFLQNIVFVSIHNSNFKAFLKWSVCEKTEQDNSPIELQPMTQGMVYYLHND